MKSIMWFSIGQHGGKMHLYMSIDPFTEETKVSNLFFLFYLIDFIFLLKHYIKTAGPRATGIP